MKPLAVFVLNLSHLCVVHQMKLHNLSFLLSTQLSDLHLSDSEIDSWMRKCVSVNLKKIDRPLQLKDSIIQQGKVYSSDKTTTKIPGNHQSLWQPSPKLVFILSLRLFIASCKAAPAHFQCIGQSGKPFELRAERDKGVRRISARIDRGDTLSPRCSVSRFPGTEVRVAGITGWQLPDRYYTQPANSDGVYSNARAEPGLLTVQPSVHWSGQGEIAHKHTLILAESLQVFVGVWWGNKVEK